MNTSIEVKSEPDTIEWEPSQALLRRSATMPTRRPLLVGLPVEYMEKSNQVPDDMIYDQTSGKFKFKDNMAVVPTSTNVVDLIDCQNLTKKAIEKYEVRAREEFKTRWKFDPTGSLDWKKITEDLKAAIATYENRAKVQKQHTKLQKYGAFFQRCFRAFTVQATAVQGWLQILPNGDYGAVVCGALQVIFHAAARVEQVRDDLMDFVGGLMETIVEMNSYAEIYENQAKLQQQILDFQVATLVALEHAIQWFGEKSSSKFFSAVKKQDDYGKELDAKSKEFRRQVQRLKDAATLNLHKRAKNIDEDIRKARLESMQGRKEVAELRLEFRGFVAQVVNSTVDVLRGNPKIIKQAKSRPQIKEESNDQSDDDSPAFAIPRYKAVSIKDLRLHVGNGFLRLADSTVQEALDRASRLSIEEQDRAEAVTNSDLLKRFLASPDSDILLVQANSAHDGHLASTSVVAATLIKGLQELHLPVLHFFCGKHKNPGNNDPFQGPYGMMKALAQEFLAVYQLDKLPFLDRSTAKFATQNLYSLGDLLHKLAANDPEPITFCIIDGISFFENTPLEQATRTVLWQLINVVSKANSCFKLLILTPTRSAYVPEILNTATSSGILRANQSNILHVPADLVHGSRRGVPPAVLAHSLSDSVVELARNR